MSLLAKAVVKNKFWIVEKNGAKYATIQTAPDGVVFVQDDHREKFASIRMLTTKYNILFDRTKATQDKARTALNQVYGFPVTGRAFNVVFDVVRKIPIFTLAAKSKSYYCAGYYQVDVHGEWQEMFCPKLLVLCRHKFHGPFEQSQEVGNDE